MKFTFTRSDLDDTGISAVTVCIFRSDLIEHFLWHIDGLGVFLASCCFGRNLCYRIEEACHLTSSVKSGRKIFFDLFLNFIVYGNFFAVFYFFHTFAISIFASYFSSNGNGLKVIFLFYSQCDHAFSDLADLFRFGLSGNDFSVIQKVGYLVS